MLTQPAVPVFLFIYVDAASRSCITFFLLFHIDSVFSLNRSDIFMGTLRQGIPREDNGLGYNILNIQCFSDFLTQYAFSPLTVF